MTIYKSSVYISDMRTLGVCESQLFWHMYLRLKTAP